jgi:hypothetical protein
VLFHLCIQRFSQAIKTERWLTQQRRKNGLLPATSYAAQKEFLMKNFVQGSVALLPVLH